MNFGIKSFINHIIQHINDYAEKTDNPYILFGIFGVITYPFYYFVWLYANPQGYENLPLRLVVVALCIPLILKNKWPEKIIYLLPLYWYIVLWYCLPFLFTFLLLKNNFSETWAFNVMTVLVLSVLLLDLKALIIILLTGISAGYFFYYATTSVHDIFPKNYMTICITYGSIIFFGALFAHRKEVIRNEKLKTTKVLSSSIAHELRTPLGTISNGIKEVKKYFPDLIESYQIAKNKNLDIPAIRPDHFEKLREILKDIDGETHYANTIINMLLMKVKQIEIKSTALEKCSIFACVNEAIHRYPFNSENQSCLVHWEEKNDFDFMGNKVFMVHVLFNLIKNAFYYIDAAGKGEIYISLKSEKKYNILYFTDTGKGIPAYLMPKLFTRFFTTSFQGTGLGLSFCKMVMNSFNGNIVCDSIENKYTKFILTFPKIEDKK